MSKQDRQPARNVTGLEYKYGLGNTLEALRGLSETSVKIQEQEKMLEAELSLRIRYDENNKIVSMLNAAADVIRLKSNRLTISSTYFTLSANGTITATAGTIGGCSIVGGVLKVPVANIEGKLTADNIDTGIFNAKVEELEGRLDGYDENFDSLDNRIKQTETSLSVLPGQIEAKVSQTDFDALGQRVETTESSLSVLPGQIASKVSQTDFDELGNRVGTAESNITQLSDKIALKVSQTDFDELGNTVNKISGELALKIGENDKGKVVSMLNASADEINLESNKMKIKSSGFSLEGGYLTVTAGKIGGFNVGYSEDFEEFVLMSTRSRYMIIRWNYNNVSYEEVGHIYTVLTSTGLWYLVENYDIDIGQYRTLAKVPFEYYPTLHETGGGGIL